MRKSAVIAVLVAASLLPAGTARAQTPSPGPAVHPIRPNQFFDGLVNGKAGECQIVMACPSVRPATTGHPAANQRVSVHQLFPPSVFPELGFTGNASTISAALFRVSPSSASAAPIPLAVFSLYDVRVA